MEGDREAELETAINEAISIHALRVEGDYVGSAMYTANLISIHALRVEGDLKYCRKVLDGTVFLSTPSGWRATAVEREKDKVVWYFYPRPPGGGRHIFQRGHAGG